MTGILNSKFYPDFQQSWNFDGPKKLVISSSPALRVKVVLFAINDRFLRP